MFGECKRRCCVKERLKEILVSNDQWSIWCPCHTGRRHRGGSAVLLASEHLWYLVSPVWGVSQLLGIQYSLFSILGVPSGCYKLLKAIIVKQNALVNCVCTERSILVKFYLLTNSYNIAKHETWLKILKYLVFGIAPLCVRNSPT